MEFFANYPPGEGQDPGHWARQVEAEGWHGVCASDHLWVGSTRYPHVFVAATQMALSTSRALVTTSFCNNLFRSPVEFAQAALALQAASHGRFEAGLGAGWAADEIAAMGGTYPNGPTRVSMYVEALTIVRELLNTGQCCFDGDFYQVDIGGDTGLAPLGERAPALVASAGGPRALREVTPLVDRVELKASARATRGGELDIGIMATVTEQELQDQVDRVRRVREDVPLGVFLLVGTGDDPNVAMLRRVLGNGFLGRFLGDSESVAQALADLEGYGISRVQITELAAGTHAQLGPKLGLQRLAAAEGP